MREKINGKLLNTSAVSVAKFQLGLANKYRGNSKKYTLSYWARVVDFLTEKYQVNKAISKKARINRRCFRW